MRILKHKNLLLDLEDLNEERQKIIDDIEKLSDELAALENAKKDLEIRIGRTEEELEKL